MLKILGITALVGVVACGGLVGAACILSARISHLHEYRHEFPRKPYHAPALRMTPHEA